MSYGMSQKPEYQLKLQKQLRKVGLHDVCVCLTATKAFFVDYSIAWPARPVLVLYI